MMRIYVDFDDCLCETGRAFSKLALEMFNKHVPYDRMQYFELGERDRWACKECGHIIAVHTGICSGCGKQYGGTER